MKIIESILTNNPCYTTNRKIKVKGLMLHSVGCPQPNASVFIRNWNKASYDNACVHAFIDGNSGDVYQTLPWDHRGWHCGRSGNDTHIGVEVCEPGCITYTSGSRFTCSDTAKARESVRTTYNSAVQLFAKLCKDFNLNPLGKGVIVSHSEGNKLGIASNHGDIEHLWEQLDTGYTMDQFRKDVQAAMGGEAPQAQTYRVRKSWADKKSQTGAYRILENAIKSCKEGYSVFDNNGNAVFTRDYKATESYKVKVEVDALNIRTGAGIVYAVNGVIRDKGIYTIVDTKGNWGKLKSGAGWICLDYVERV